MAEKERGSVARAEAVIACAWALVFLAWVALFGGTPDLADAVIYKLTDGKYQIPAYQE